MHPIFFQLGWNLDGDWPIRRQNPYQHQFVNVNNNNYTCCAKMAGKEETPTCRKKTVTWTNEMIEDLIDFIEIHPIVAFEAIHEPILTSFWSLISFAVQLYIIMQYKGKHPPLLPEMPFCLLYLPPKLVCIHQNFLYRVYTNLNSSFLDPGFLEWRLGCKTCIVYTGLKKISNVALLTFEGAAFNVTFLALLLIFVYPLTMVLKQQIDVLRFIYTPYL